MMCTTVIHGGVCYRTSTPHKSGNKMKEKMKKNIATTNLAACVCQCVCVCAQNLTNFCPDALISTPNVPKILFA